MKRRNAGLVAALFALCSAACLEARGDEKDDKKDTKPGPPRVCVTLPLALRIGVTNQMIVRGLNLTNVTALHFTNVSSELTAEIKAARKAEVPKDADVKKVGDTQVEVSVAVPPDFLRGTNWFMLTSPEGTSELKPLLFLPANELVAEKEPNDGFTQAQPVELGETISGSVKEPGDVDVYQFSGNAGTTVTLTIRAAVEGSTLDSLLTLSDSANRILASNDDSANGADSMLRLRLPQTGVYRISLQDANDRGGPTHVYLLEVRVAGD